MVTLHRLVYAHPQAKLYSPHVWKTQLDLAFLGIEADTVDNTFCEVRGSLSELTGNNAVTVPTLEYSAGSSPQFVTDSFTIAQHLEETVAKSAGKSLFGSEEGKNFARFLELWSGTVLGDELRPLIVAKVWEAADENDKAYFGKKIGGQPKLDFLANLESTPELLEKQLAGARNKLGLIETLLKEKVARGESGWLAGKEVSHADFVLFGWYGFSSINPLLIKGVWDHESLPNVKTWVAKILASGLVDKKILGGH